MFKNYFKFILIFFALTAFNSITLLATCNNSTVEETKEIKLHPALIITPKTSAWETINNEPRLETNSNIIEKSGIKELDELNKKYGVNTMLVHYEKDTKLLYIQFKNSAENLELEKVKESYEKLPCIESVLGWGFKWAF
ncbi:hypothetical protein KAW80_00840 [Candidatus Babeliales bacterium]|nr:hypothetical protein [Candidatus Babeliales bacterium]